VNPLHRPRQNFQAQNNMKNQTQQKISSQPNLNAGRRLSLFRAGSKHSVHRYERRKVREQLRHLGWALAGED